MSAWISFQEKHLLRSVGHKVALAWLSARAPREGGAQAVLQSALGAEGRIISSRKTLPHPGQRDQVLLRDFGRHLFENLEFGTPYLDSEAGLPHPCLTVSVRLRWLG